jgi:hypothetical protein
MKCYLDNMESEKCYRINNLVIVSFSEGKRESFRNNSNKNFGDIYGKSCLDNFLSILCLFV